MAKRSTAEEQQAEGARARRKAREEELRRRNLDLFAPNDVPSLEPSPPPPPKKKKKTKPEPPPPVAAPVPAPRRRTSRAGMTIMLDYCGQPLVTAAGPHAPPAMGPRYCYACETWDCEERDHDISWAALAEHGAKAEPEGDGRRIEERHVLGYARAREAIRFHTGGGAFETLAEGRAVELIEPSQREQKDLSDYERQGRQHALIRWRGRSRYVPGTALERVGLAEWQAQEEHDRRWRARRALVTLLAIRARCLGGRGPALDRAAAGYTRGRDTAARSGVRAGHRGEG